MSPDPLRRRIAIAAVLAAAVSSPAEAAQTVIRPRIDVGAVHETNPRLQSNDVAEDATGMVVEGRLNMSWQSPQNRIYLDPRVRFTRYSDDDFEDLEDNDVWISTGIEHTTARSQSVLGFQYSWLGVRTSELESAEGTPGGSGDIRFIDDTQERWSVDPSWAYQLTRRDLITVSGGYSDISYQENKDRVTGRFDYTYLFLETSWRHSFTPRLALGALLSGSQFESENPAVKRDPASNPGRATDNDSTTYGGSLFADFALTERLTASVYGGARTTEIELEVTPLRNAIVINPAPPPILIIADTCDLFNFPSTFAPPPCLQETEGDNFVGQASLTRSSERSELDFSISRSISPNSNGAETVRDEFRVNFRRDFSERLRGRLGILYYQQEDAAVQTNRDRDYLSAQLNVEWRLTPEWGFRGTYRFIWVSDDFRSANDIDTDNHRFFLGAFYRPPGWRWP